MATIYIRNLVVEAKHGVHEHEKIHAQRFVVSVELTVDTTKAAASDNLEDTVNWSLVRDKIIATTQNSSYNLIEKLAQEIANSLLEDQLIRKVTVSIDKLDAFTSGVPGLRLEVSN